MEEQFLRFIRNKIEGKRVLILGFGREGRGSLSMILRAGGYSALAIADSREIEEEELLPFAGKERLPLVISGEDHLSAISDYDLVFKSPGIVLTDEQFRSSVLTSQTECFLEMYGNRVIGITGTKGKSTTTTLIYHVLKESGADVLLMGNIGIPAFDRVSEVKETTVVVFELSSHQLQEEKFSPKTAVYLNVFPEHLDHYKDYDAYRVSKENIYRHQSEEDRLYCGSAVIPAPESHRGRLTVIYDLNRGDGELFKEGEAPTSFIEGNAVYHEGAKLLLNEEEIPIKGDHNLFDVAVAFAVLKDFGISEEDFKSALRTYRPLPHRLELFGTFRGVKYYDDSISTIPATTIAALETVSDADTVIIGGIDRGIDYAPLISYLSESKVPHIILMEFTGARINEEIMTGNMELYNSGRLILVDDLKEAVKKAKEVTGEGRSCILSPAAASYGIFKNFEERGEVFKRLVKED